ncbi:MAG: hypothetical protein WCC48_12935 [Anaeromyxobacteraceae bacterium]
MTRSKIPALVGSAAAIITFFVIGLLPAMAYGGYAGHLLAGGIVGAESGGIIARALVVFGMALGVVGIGSLFAVLGAMTGALVGAVTRLDARKPATEAVAEK